MALPASFNVLSLCTGGGGLDMGFELAIPAARTVCMVEREAFAVAHLVAAMRGGLLHDAPVWSDAGTFNGRPWRGVVDCVIGGIPCQPHSQAGKRQGREDERDLWSDARRIIVQTGARFVLIENVSGMLSTGGAARVVGDLQRLGFIVEGGLFTAREVGFSHRRERCFMLAYRAGVGLADACGEGSQGLRPDTSALGREDARRLSGLRGGAAVADAPCQRQREPADETNALARSRQAWDEPGNERRDVADADQPEPSGRLQRAGQQPQLQQDDGAGGTDMEHAARVGRGEGRPEHVVRRGRNAASGSGGGDVEDTARHDRRLHTRPGRPEQAPPNAGGASQESLADAGGRDDQRRPDQPQREPQGRDSYQRASGPDIPLSPPGPGDLDGWRRILDAAPELEPAVCRVADELADGLDGARHFDARTDRLRLLGNGVVPLEAAHAVRNLSARLGRRSAECAAELAVMGAADLFAERSA